MTDKELLELAAKAVGYDDASWNTEKGCIETAKLDGFRCYWNPLTDDGDALRLAVKLHTTLLFEYELSGWDVEANFCGENCATDPYAATRRAIVRAAAEMGKTLEKS